MISKTKYDTPVVIEPKIDSRIEMASNESLDGSTSPQPDKKAILEPNADLEKILGDAMGAQFASSMAEEGFHPVLIFGAPASGKTAFILSLIKYIYVGAASSAQIRLSLDLFPNESSSIRGDLVENDRLRWSEIKKYANTLFNKQATDFLQANQIVAYTKVLYPFFVPIEITPKKEGLKPLKIAFLEGMGEWYKPQLGDESLSPHKSFRPEILAFLENYPGAITSIFVAPYALESYESIDDGESAASAPKMRERDFGLYGLIDQLEKCRANQIESDNYLYLLTKWDIRCKSISNPEFIYKNTDILRDEIQSKFPMSFNRFQNIREISVQNSDVKQQNRKMVSAYCAGIMKASVMNLPMESRHRVDHFSRKLWNYFYLNSNNDYLYEEFRPVKIGFIQKIINWFRR